MTAPRGLLAWAAEPDPERGVWVRRPAGGWDRIPYPRLAGAVAATAAVLRTDGARPGDAVGLVCAPGGGFLAGLFGILAAGATPVPLAPPALFEPAGRARERLAAALGAVRAARAVADDTGAGAVAGPVRVVAPAAGDVPAAWAPTPGPGPALLQSTSGSAGTPRAVAVSAPGLEAHLEVIREWLRLGRDDPTATWLPPHHDMGLVGCLLAPVVSGADVWVMTPREFLRDPGTWLDCFGRHGARLGAVPAFGLAHLLRRIDPDRVAAADWDLSGWRALVVGAERVDADVLERVTRLLAPRGFRSGTLLPAYGLAEATLAVTGARPGEPPRTRRPAPHSLAPGRRVEPAAPDAAGVPAVVSCGVPLPGGSRVDVVDGDGRALPPGHVGEIVVTGAGVADGYRGTEPGTPASFRPNGVLHTGDLGFQDDDGLFVLGRMGDAVHAGGRTLLAEDLEALLARVPGLAAARPVVLLGEARGRPRAVALVELPPGPWAAPALRVLRGAADGVAVRVLSARRGTVARTTSGKPRRRAMWRSYLAGTLTATEAARPVAVPR